MAQRLPVVALCFGGLQPVCDSAQGGAGAARSEACAFSTHWIMRTQAHGRRASLTGGHAAPVVTHRARVAGRGLLRPIRSRLLRLLQRRCAAALRYAAPLTPTHAVAAPQSTKIGTRRRCHPLTVHGLSPYLRTYVPTSSTWSAKRASEPSECCALGMTLVCGRRRRHTYRRRAVRLVATVRLQTRSATTRTSQHS